MISPNSDRRPFLLEPHVPPVHPAQVLDDFRVAEEAVGRLRQRLVSEESKLYQAKIMQMVGELRAIADLIRSGELVHDPIAPPVNEVELPRRPMGEDTLEIERRVLGNRGRHGRHR